MTTILTALTGTLLAQTAAGPPVVTGARLESVWDFVVKGGPTMGVIIACSLVALAVIVERAVILRRRSVVPADIVAQITAAAGSPARALDLCRADRSPVARVLEAAIKRRGDGFASVEKAVEEAGRRELVQLRHRMRLLGALPQVSTMLGLLGTIFGMIKTFQAVAASGQALGKTELLAKGIFEAWTNTAAGLLVAIPVLIAYHVLMGKIDALMVELDQVAVDFVENERTRPAVAPPPAARERAEATAVHNAPPTREAPLAAIGGAAA